MNQGKTVGMERALRTLYGEGALLGEEPCVNFSEPASVEALSDIYPKFADGKHLEQNPLPVSLLVFDELTNLINATQYTGSKRLGQPDLRSGGNARPLMAKTTSNKSV